MILTTDINQTQVKKHKFLQTCHMHFMRPSGLILFYPLICCKRQHLWKSKSILQSVTGLPLLAFLWTLWKLWNMFLNSSLWRPDLSHKPYPLTHCCSLLRFWMCQHVISGEVTEQVVTLEIFIDDIKIIDCRHYLFRVN